MHTATDVASPGWTVRDVIARQEMSSPSRTPGPTQPDIGLQCRSVDCL